MEEEKEMLENVEHALKNFNGRAIDCIAIGEMLIKYKDLLQENKASKEAINILTNKLEKVVDENNELKEGCKTCVIRNDLNEYVENSIPISVIQNRRNEYLDFDKKHKTYTKDGRENFTMEYFKAKALDEILDLKE